MTNVVKIRSYGELISSIPHTLGFTPSQSMVCLSFGDGPTARVDLPHSPEEMGEWVQMFTDVYLRRHHPRRVALVAYEDAAVRRRPRIQGGGATEGRQGQDQTAGDDQLLHVIPFYESPTIHGRGARLIATIRAAPFA